MVEHGWPGRRRIALYSHDAMGLGHLRRNLAIASTLAAGPSPCEILLLSGSRELTSFTMPPGVDSVTLPALAKHDSAYHPRTLTGSLAEVVRLRSAILTAALTSFAPDVLIVDKLARGVCDELDSALWALRTAGGTRCVLGLRDVLDDPVTTAAEWEASGTGAAVDRFYDAVWFYGDPDVFDPRRAYPLPPSVAEASTMTGYLGRRRRPLDGRAATLGHVEPYVLCLVGGGQDGQALAEAFVGAALPPGHRGVLVTGPYMADDDQRRLKRLAGPEVSVLEFVEDCARLVDDAAAVVSMGGYNTVCEVLAAGHRPLLVPRVRPRTEQLIRAEAFAARGLVDLVHPDRLTARVLTRWLAGATAGPVARRHPGTAVDLCGLARIPGLVDDLLTLPPRRAERTHGAA